MSKRLPKTFRSLAEGFALDYVLEQIGLMLNPLHQGPNWDWNKFPEWVSNRAASAAFWSLPPNQWTDEFKEVVTETSFKAAKDFLKESDILNWQHKISI